MPLSKSYNYIITIEGNAYNLEGYNNWDNRMIDPDKIAQVNKYTKNFEYNLAVTTILQDFYNKQNQELPINHYILENKINKYIDENFDFKKLKLNIHIAEEIKKRLYCNFYSMLPKKRDYTVPYQLTSILIATENGVHELFGITKKELDEAIIKISKNL